MPLKRTISSTPIKTNGACMMRTHASKGCINPTAIASTSRTTDLVSATTLFSYPGTEDEFELLLGPTNDDGYVQTYSTLTTKISYPGRNLETVCETSTHQQYGNDRFRRYKRTISSTPTKTNWCAILLAFLSGVFFTLCSALVKEVHCVAPMSLLSLRSAIQVAAMLPIVAFRQESPLGPRGLRGLLVLQGVVGGFTLVLLFVSFRRLPLGDATSIIFSSPVFVLILSCMFLREPCGFFRTLIVFLLLTGVVLIAKPPIIFGQQGTHVHYDALGYSAALLGTFFTALNIVVMRRCQEVHFSMLVLHFSLWSLLISTTLLYIRGPWSADGSLLHASTFDWTLAVLVGVSGLTGQVLLAHALSKEGAGKVAVTRSLDIVLAFVLQVTFWGEVPNWQSTFGAILVFLCVVGIGFEEQLTRKAASVP